MILRLTGGKYLRQRREQKQHHQDSRNVSHESSPLAIFETATEHKSGVAVRTQLKTGRATMMPRSNCSAFRENELVSVPSKGQRVLVQDLPDS